MPPLHFLSVCLQPHSGERRTAQAHKLEEVTRTRNCLYVKVRASSSLPVACTPTAPAHDNAHTHTCKVCPRAHVRARTATLQPHVALFRRAVATSAHNLPGTGTQHGNSSGGQEQQESQQSVRSRLKPWLLFPQAHRQKIGTATGMPLKTLRITGEIMQHSPTTIPAHCDTAAMYACLRTKARQVPLAAHAGHAGRRKAQLARPAAAKNDEARKHL